MKDYRTWWRKGEHKDSLYTGIFLSIRTCIFMIEKVLRIHEEICDCQSEQILAITEGLA